MPTYKFMTSHFSDLVQALKFINLIANLNIIHVYIFHHL
jgi:hypothetical protein